MLFSSPVYSAASGSIAGITYSHGRGGKVCKSRSTPTNPDTERQRTVKHALARLSPFWGQNLTQAQRNAWDLYGDNVAMTNVLGKTIFLTGQNHFLRANIPRIQSGISVLTTAPTVYDLGTFTAPTIQSIVFVVNEINIAYENTDAWANAAGGFMLIYMGKTTGPGRAFFGGPYRFAGSIVGDAVPPVSPDAFTPPWPISPDNIAWAIARVIQVDGRMSLPIVLGPKTIEVF